MLSTFGKLTPAATSSWGRPPSEGARLRISRVPSREARRSRIKDAPRRMPDAMLDTLRESSVDEEIVESKANKKQVPEKSSAAVARRPAGLALRFYAELRERGEVVLLRQSNNCAVSGCIAETQDNYYRMDSNGNSDAYSDQLPIVISVRADGAKKAHLDRRLSTPLEALEFPPPPTVPPPVNTGDPPMEDNISDDGESYATASEARGGADGSFLTLSGSIGPGDLAAIEKRSFARTPGATDDTPQCDRRSVDSDGSAGTSGVSQSHSMQRSVGTSSPLTPTAALTAYALRGPSADCTPTDARALADDCSLPSVDMMSVDSTNGSDSSFQKPARNRVVVAIDFGTAFSGYAYSFVKDPSHIYVMRKWEGGDPGVLNQKIPTCLLLSPDNQFHSFGYGARDFYNNLTDEDAKRWPFFDKFKMVLHGRSELNEKTTLTASNGVSMPARTIFAYALAFFKEHALNELEDQCGVPVATSDIKWVITVPAIWKQPAKQFMRHSAYEAGLADSNDPGQLLISLEPEAASIYCRHQKYRELVPDTPPPPPRLSIRRCSDVPLIGGPCVGDTLKHGSRYMVVDCGGGTVDITVHEVDCEAGQLNELHRASGGPYGSVGVDSRFEILLKDIFSADFIETFKRKRPAGFIDLMVCFEARKRSVSPYKDLPLNVALPFSFIDYYKKLKGNTVESAIRRFNDPEVCWSPQGMLRLTQTAMRRLFLPVLDSIKQAIGDVLNHPEVKGIECLFLVGGFADSPLLQSAIRKDFSSILKVIIPQDASMSIVKGAVMYGLDPTVVRARRCPLTYGIGALHRYVAAKHPAGKLIRRNGQEWCTDIFDKLVTANQAVAPGEVVVRSYTPANTDQCTIVINLYCTEKRDVLFVTEPGVRKCATLRLDLPNVPLQQPSHGREIQAQLSFGETEIRVTAVDVASGMNTGAVVDFFVK